MALSTDKRKHLLLAVKTGSLNNVFGIGLAEEYLRLYSPLSQDEAAIVNNVASNIKDNRYYAELKPRINKVVEGFRLFYVESNPDRALLFYKSLKSIEFPKNDAFLERIIPSLIPSDKI